MLHNFNCCETRIKLLCCWYLLHGRLNLPFRQCKLHNIFIFGMAYFPWNLSRNVGKEKLISSCRSKLHITMLALHAQGVDLAYLNTGISGVGYFWTTTPKYFATKRKPPKYFPKIKPLTDTPLTKNAFIESSVPDDNNEELCLLNLLVNKTGSKIAVEHVKHVKIHHLFGNPNKYSNYDQHQKIQIFELQTPQKYPADPYL